ncbi:PspC domain-containing protein [Lacticaseibacillus jixiensis]|uniref:PspC domain-containing protein n=1 Tax=Lacticaseibacillus jixiensis TaxID=3231926 RepID=UPI0036F24921
MNQSYRKLRRSRDNAVIGGVCGGLGEYFGIDPVLLRIAFAAAFFCFGSGLGIYLIMWLVIPQAPHAPHTPHPDDTAAHGHEDDDDWSDF